MDFLLFIIFITAFVWFSRNVLAHMPPIPSALSIHAESIERELKEGKSPLVPLEDGLSSGLTCSEEKEWKKIVKEFNQL